MSTTKMTNEQAYHAYVKLCADRKYWATYSAVTEDGFDSKMDWILLYQKAMAEEVDGNDR